MPHNFFHLDANQMTAAMAELDEDVAAEQRFRRMLEGNARQAVEEFETAAHLHFASQPHVRLSGNQPFATTIDPSNPGGPYLYGHVPAPGVHVAGNDLSIADQYDRDEIVIAAFEAGAHWPAYHDESNITNVDLQVRSHAAFELWFGEQPAGGGNTYQVLIGL